MKRLSALLIGAFMLVGANSVMAVEGDFKPANASAINAAMQGVQQMGEAKTWCGDLPSNTVSEGTTIENVCVKIYDDGAELRSDLPDFENPSY